MRLDGSLLNRISADPRTHTANSPTPDLQGSYVLDDLELVQIEQRRHMAKVSEDNVAYLCAPFCRLSPVRLTAGLAPGN
jgi:hypothetical protein